MNKDTAKYLPLIISTAAASFMVNLDTYIINVSIPAIAADFLVEKADISWVIMSYNLLVVSLLLICGKLADKVGLKKLFIFGFIIFTLSSLFCAISQNLSQLIISRVIQGIGASILYALPQAIIGKFIPKEHRGECFGYSASAAALGIMLGSPLSGLITGLLSWHWIFLINIPVGIFIILLILKNDFGFEDKNSQNVSGFDIVGAVLSFLAVFGLTFWLNRLNSLGFKNSIMLGILFISILLTISFIVHCLKTKNPLVDITLFKNKYFCSANTAMFLLSGILAGNNFIMPFYFTEINHLKEFQIGILLMVYSLSYMCFSLLYGKVSKKISAAKVSSLAGLISILAMLFFLFSVYFENTGILTTVIFFIMLGMSFSFFITSNNNYIMSQANQNNAGAIAGLHRMTGRFGMLFGVVFFEFIFTYSNKLSLNSYFYTYIAALGICILITLLSSYCIKDKQS